MRADSHREREEQEVRRAVSIAPNGEGRMRRDTVFVLVLVSRLTCAQLRQEKKKGLELCKCRLEIYHRVEYRVYRVE